MMKKRKNQNYRNSKFFITISAICGIIIFFSALKSINEILLIFLCLPVGYFWEKGVQQELDEAIEYDQKYEVKIQKEEELNK